MMKFIKGNIWDFHEKGKWICIPTNGFVKKNGRAVMGAGLALDCKRKFPDFDELLGKFIKRYGNTPIMFPNHRVMSFPVKINWWEKADLLLIEKSAIYVSRFLNHLAVDRVFLPRVGCGNGKLKWKDVKKILNETFEDDDRIVIVKYEHEGGLKK